MAELRWTQQAEADLDAIVRYIALDNLDAALWLDNQILQAAEGLAIQPLMGKPGRVPFTRELTPHKHYIIVYTADNEVVEIQTILHTSQEWPPIKKEDEDLLDAE